MATQSDKPEQKVNPLLLILLGVVVVGGGIYYFMSSKPSPSPPAPVAAAPNMQPPTQDNATESPTVANVENPDPKLKPNEKLNDPNAKKTENEDKPIRMALNRNPFRVPGIYLKDNNPTLPQQQTPTVVASPVINNQPPKDDMSMRLGGIFLKNNDKVALIYYIGKGFIIRENERVKGSEYQLKQIRENSVILVKSNGEEKILKIEDITLKLKGGDH